MRGQLSAWGHLRVSRRFTDQADVQLFSVAPIIRGGGSVATHNSPKRARDCAKLKADSKTTPLGYSCAANHRLLVSSFPFAQNPEIALDG
jgi:hypothetical protein